MTRTCSQCAHLDPTNKLGYFSQPGRVFPNTQFCLQRLVYVLTSDRECKLFSQELATCGGCVAYEGDELLGMCSLRDEARGFEQASCDGFAPIDPPQPPERPPTVCGDCVVYNGDEFFGHCTVQAETRERGQAACRNFFGKKQLYTPAPGWPVGGKK